MALNFADRAKVRENIVGRCVVLVASYAVYLINGGTAAGVTQEQAVGWGRSAIREPNVVGERVSWYVVNEQAFIDTGSSISDATLEAVVQAALRSHFMGA